MLVAYCTYTSPNGHKYKMIGYSGTREEWRRYLNRTYGAENISEVRFSESAKTEQMKEHNAKTRKEKLNAKKTA